MLKKVFKKALDASVEVTNDHVGAYAAQAAYFFVLCMIPIILLLLTMVQYTPVTKADVMTAVIQVFPTSVDTLIVSIVNEVYNQSSTIIPITIIVALWSAGKGVLSITTGLNCVYKCPETRNYVYLRIRASVYTVLFIIVLILLLVLSVFGNTLNLFIASHIEFLRPVADWLITNRTIIASLVIFTFALFLYKFLPNRKDTIKHQIPGSIFLVVAWLVLSWIFSVYLDVFEGFSNMYGSLTTIVLIMLWLYFCMYSLLLGGELNKMIEEKWFSK